MSATTTRNWLMVVITEGYENLWEGFVPQVPHKGEKIWLKGRDWPVAQVIWLLDQGRVQVVVK